MRFTWNEEKRQRNLRVHGLDFADVPVAVVHTETEEAIHVISFRKATRRETALFFASFPN